MRRWFCIFIAAWTAGCAWTTPVPPGLGESSQSSHRLAADRDRARIVAAQNACRAADARVTDARMQRKAAETTAHALSLTSSSKTEVLTVVKPTLARLASGTCTDRLEAGRVYEAADADAAAADLYVQAARECKTTEAAMAAHGVLLRQGKCEIAVPLLAQAWSGSPKDQWISLFDAVAKCSSTVTLRRNLSFLPEDVREDYFALLEERQRVAQEEKAERKRREREQRAEEARQESRSRCASHCSSARSQCESSCAGAQGCSSHCGAVGSACLAGCQ